MIDEKGKRGGADLDEEVLLELGGSLLVGLALGALLYEGVQVEAQVAHLVAQVLTGLSPASSSSSTIVRVVLSTVLAQVSMS